VDVIHVAGTKGKGATCAFACSFLKAHGERTGFPKKIGLYTSPHLTSVRERIRINFTPLSEEVFAKYFFEVWEKVSSHALQHSYRLPGPLQLLMLVSVHAFDREGVDAAICEAHHGGEYCATNLLSPTVTGITTLGLDYSNSLGPVIENVAWHKGGIFKPGIPAFSSPQTPEAAKVLQDRAAEKGIQLKFIDINPVLQSETSLVLEPEVQRVNASLAIALASTLLTAKATKEEHGLTSQDIFQGIKQYAWPGRFHRVMDGSRQWFLDSAHNELSLKIASRWFAKSALENSGTSGPRILIFSHQSFRNGPALLKSVAESLEASGIQMEHVIFVPTGEGREAYSHGCITDWQDIANQYVETWRRIDSKAHISLQPTIYDALELAKRIGDRQRGMQTFVTGDVRLIGPCLEALEGYSSQ
jgi:folylpolyglutamate synthase